MSAVTVRTREATHDDVLAIGELWDELRRHGGRVGPFGPPASAVAIRERLEALRHDPAHRVVVAEIDEVVVGLAVLSRMPLTPISDVETVQISFMHVRDDRRRRGVGRAIVSAAAAFAADAAVDYVSVGVFPGCAREQQVLRPAGLQPIGHAARDRHVGAQETARG